MLPWFRNAEIPYTKCATQWIKIQPARPTNEVMFLCTQSNACDALLVKSYVHLKRLESLQMDNGYLQSWEPCTWEQVEQMFKMIKALLEFLEMGRGFRVLATGPPSNHNSSTPPPTPLGQLYDIRPVVTTYCTVTESHQLVCGRLDHVQSGIYRLLKPLLPCKKSY